MTARRDIPGADNFIARMTTIASEMAFAFAHEADDHVMAELERMRPALTRDFLPALGVKATDAAEMFIRTVMTEKHRIEGLPMAMA